jgi:hypothetical protein
VALLSACTTQPKHLLRGRNLSQCEPVREGSTAQRLHELGQVLRGGHGRGQNVHAVGQQTEGVDGEFVVATQFPDLPEAVGVVGFIEKNGLLVLALAHQAVRVAREQKAILIRQHPGARRTQHFSR